MRTRIHVTERDIIWGEPSSSHACPIAQSLQRRGLENIAVTFDPDTGDEAVLMFLADDGCTLEHVIKLPNNVRRFIEKFDMSRLPVQPFRFRLEDENDFLIAEGGKLRRNEEQIFKEE